MQSLRWHVSLKMDRQCSHQKGNAYAKVYALYFAKAPDATLGTDAAHSYGTSFLNCAHEVSENAQVDR